LPLFQRGRIGAFAATGKKRASTLTGAWAKPTWQTGLRSYRPIARSSDTAAAQAQAFSLYPKGTRWRLSVFL